MGMADAWKVAGTFFAGRARRAEGQLLGSVCLVCLVFLVCLVGLAGPRDGTG